MTPDQIQAILTSGGTITDIGQIDPCGKKLLARLVRRGDVVTGTNMNWPSGKKCYLLATTPFPLNVI